MLLIGGGGGFDAVRAVKKGPHRCVEVTLLKSDDNWQTFVDYHGSGLQDNQKELGLAMVMFRRATTQTL